MDYNVKIRVKSDKSGVELDNVKMSINPFDEIACEEAVKFKESGQAHEVVAVSIGVDKSEDVIRTALAMGADRGILVKATADIQPLDVAKILVSIIEKESPDLVLMGKQAIDDDSNQTGQMLAAILEWPQATFASNIAIEGKTVEVQREVDAGLETVSCDLPAIITSDLRLNEPRYTSLPNIMKARSKPLETMTPEDLGVSITPRLTVLKVEEPATRQAGEKVASVEELVNILKKKEIL